MFSIYVELSQRKSKSRVGKYSYKYLHLCTRFPDNEQPGYGMKRWPLEEKGWKTCRSVNVCVVRTIVQYCDNDCRGYIGFLK